MRKKQITDRRQTKQCNKKKVTEMNFGKLAASVQCTGGYYTKDAHSFRRLIRLHNSQALFPQCSAGLRLNSISKMISHFRNTNQWNEKGKFISNMFLYRVYKWHDTHSQNMYVCMLLHGSKCLDVDRPQTKIIRYYFTL